MDRHGRPPRHPTWDYANAGGYFVTFVVGDRSHVLRRPDGKLSAEGEVVRGVWGRLPSLYSRVDLDDLAIMPDHVHAILWLTDRPSPRVPLGEVVRGWKAASSRGIRITLPGFVWQSHYHDRILLTRELAMRARRYIRHNLNGLGQG